MPTLPGSGRVGRRNRVLFCIFFIMYIVQLLNEGEAEKGSEQDFLDNLHNYFPPKNIVFVNGKCIVGPNGIGNRVANAFEYTKTQGLALEVDWPFVGECKHTESNKELY